MLKRHIHKWNNNFANTLLTFYKLQGTEQLETKRFDINSAWRKGQQIFIKTEYFYLSLVDEPFFFLWIRNLELIFFVTPYIDFH